MLHRKPLSGPSNATLHLIDDQHNAVPIANPAQFLHEDGGSNDVTTFALYRLDEDRRHFFRSQRGLEQFLFDKARAAQGKFFALLRSAPGPAIYIRIADVGNSRHQGRETPPLLRFGCGQRECTHRAPVKRAEERDDVLPLGVIARQLQGTLDRLRSRVSIVNTVRPFHRCDLRKALGQLHHALVIEVGARHMNQFARLLLDSGDHIGMAVAGRGHSDTR